MEENKVAQKLRKIIHAASNSDADHPCYVCGEISDAILQSPDLRVTLVEPPPPRYYVEEKNEAWPFRIFDRTHGWLFCRFSCQQAAEAYCDWLNSKEPK